MNIDIHIFLGSLTTIVTVGSFFYVIFRNFKADIIAHIEKLERRMDNYEQRMDNYEQRLSDRMNSMDERIFFALTGKKLEDAIREEKMKHPKSDP